MASEEVDDERSSIYSTEDADKQTKPRTIEDGNPVILSVLKEPTELASYPSCMINMLKTMIGAGILTAPWAFSKVGYAVGILLLLLAGSLSILGLHLLTFSATRTGRKSSLADLAELTFPRFIILFELTMVIKCMGTAVSYFNIIGKAAVKIFQYYTNATGTVFVSNAFWAVLAAIIITPVCLMHRIESLKYTSAFGLFGAVYLVCLGVYFYFTKNIRIYPSTFETILPVAPLSTAAFEAYSTFVFIFACHQTILHIQNEARNNTSKGMLNIIMPGVFIAFTLCVIFALFGYAGLGNIDESNAIEAFPKEGLPYIIARGFFIVLLLASMPLVIFPSRESIIKIIYRISPSFLESHRISVHYFTSLICVIVATFIGSLPISLGTIVAIIGSTVGTAVCYFIPATIYLNLYGNSDSLFRRIGAYILIFVGSCTSAIGLAPIIYELIKKSR